MKPLSPNTDPVYLAPARFSGIDNFFLKRLKDERDLPFVKLILKISFSMLPVGLLLFFPLPQWLSWILALSYTYLNNFVFKGSFGLMLHCTSHRILFKNDYKYLNHYLPWVLGPFFGQTPETYYCHHLGMHHAENNLEDDLSSTMHYQRDIFGDFMKYFAAFFFTGLLDLTRYFSRLNRRKLRNRVLRGEIMYFVLCAVLLYVNPGATIVLFVLPFIISRFIMMLGNWTQHAFVDYDEPGNCYKNSITCINTSYNQKCWNDGYHIDHHLKPAMHYTEYPGHFRNHLELFARNKALVFSGIHYLHIWYYLMQKDYQTLAAHLVHIPGGLSSEEEAIALMKSRTQRMPVRGISVQTLKQGMAG